MNILFVVPYDNIVFFPLGSAYVAAQALKDGHQVITLDLSAYRMSPSHFVKIIKNTRFDVAAVTGSIHQYASIEWVVNEIKKQHPGRLVVAGGDMITIAYEVFLQNDSVDAVFVDEAVFGFSEYLSAIENGRDISAIDGVFRKDKDGNITGRRRKFIEDLDILPLPAWDLFPMDVYLKTQSRFFIGPEFPIATSRGCPHSCVFCRNTKSKHMRYHSLERVFLEIEILHRRHGADTFRIIDENFIQNTSRVEEFCEGIIKSGMDIIWQCHARADFKDFHLLDKLYRAGCRGFMIGMESGSQKILDDLKKDLDVNQARETIIKVTQSGIVPNVAFMIGTPGETRETMRETYEFLKSCGFPNRSFNYLTPVPCSDIWGTVIREGHIKNPSEYLKNKASFITPTINLTALPDDELKKETIILLKKAGKHDKSTLRSRAKKEKLFGKKILRKLETEALLYHDYPAFLFFHQQKHGINEDGRFYKEKKYDLPAIEKRLSSLSFASFQIALKGAEPTTHIFFEEILELPVFRSFTYMRIYSNGQRFSDRAFLKRALALGVTEFVITLCGPDVATHELHAGEQGGFNRTLAGIRNILSLRMPLMAAIPLTRFNIDRLHEFPPLFKDAGITVVQLDYEPNLSAQEPQTLFPSLNEVREALDGALGIFKAAKLKIRVDGVPPCALASRDHLYISKTTPYCITNLEAPMRNPFYEGKYLQGPMCVNCSRNQCCVGIHPNVYNIHGWKGLNAIPWKGTPAAPSKPPQGIFRPGPS